MMTAEKAGIPRPILLASWQICGHHPGWTCRAVLGWLLRCVERAAQRRALSELNDRLLRDIGLTREEVIPEIRKPFWRD